MSQRVGRRTCRALFHFEIAKGRGRSCAADFIFSNTRYHSLAGFFDPRWGLTFAAFSVASFFLMRALETQLARWWVALLLLLEILLLIDLLNIFLVLFLIGYVHLEST